MAKTKFKDFPILVSSLMHIYRNINFQIDKSISPIISGRTTEAISDADNFSKHSYNWDSLNETEKINQVKRLYQLLTAAPAIISADEDDFINAFTNKKVSAGISWLLIGRNKLYSKVSIFYLIYKLNEEGFIDDFDQYEFGKKIEYVFRDNLGQEIGNTKQSLTEFRKILSTEHSDRIDEIISKIIE